MSRLSEARISENESVQRLILELLQGRAHSTVVSINTLLVAIRKSLPDCRLSNQELARQVFEASMLLGLVPVYDPETESGPEGDFRGPYGYGHHAHKADPSARYGFEAKTTRPLPVKPGERWR